MSGEEAEQWGRESPEPVLDGIDGQGEDFWPLLWVRLKAVEEGHDLHMSSQQHSGYGAAETPSKEARKQLIGFCNNLVGAAVV